MKPDYYVKANGTVVMAYALFQALNPERVCRMLSNTRTPAAYRDKREERTLTIDVMLPQRTQQQ